MYEVRLPIAVLENQGHGTGLDGDLAVAGQNMSVRIASLSRIV